MRLCFVLCCSVIILMIDKSDSRFAITHLVTDWIRLHHFIILPDMEDRTCTDGNTCRMQGKSIGVAFQRAGLSSWASRGTSSETQGQRKRAVLLFPFSPPSPPPPLFLLSPQFSVRLTICPGVFKDGCGMEPPIVFNSEVLRVMSHSLWRCPNRLKLSEMLKGQNADSSRNRLKSNKKWQGICRALTLKLRDSRPDALSWTGGRKVYRTKSTNTLASTKNNARRSLIWGRPSGAVLCKYCQLLRPKMYHTTVALTQISAYIPHKNLAVRKIKEAMPVRKKKRDSVSTRLKQNMKQTITEQYASMWKESAHRLRWTFYFAESFDKLNFVKLNSFLYFFSLVSILYANFSTRRQGLYSQTPSTNLASWAPFSLKLHH